MRYKRQAVAFLFMGSAALLLSCNSKKTEPQNPETLVTQRGDSLTMLVSKNGHKSYVFKTDHMEEYGLARDPYTLYPNGVFVETFKDSTDVVESSLRADQAVRYIKRDLWMASGNVVASGSGRTLYTEQLFWDEKTDRIYSNVKSRIVDSDGEQTGTGFESDKDLKQWVFRDFEGAFAVDTTPASEEEKQAVAQQESESGNASSGDADSENRNGQSSTGWRRGGSGPVRRVSAFPNRNSNTTQDPGYSSQDASKRR